MDSSEFLINNLLHMWWIVLAAVISPLFAIITRRKIPDVVWLLSLGVLIGEHGLGLAKETGVIEFIRQLGLGFLFLLAGFEVNTRDMRGKEGRNAALTWLLCVVLGFGAAWLLTDGQWQVAVVMALVSTSTALGTLLPIVKDSGLLERPLGKAVMVHGAFGELLPIIAMSLFLSTRGTFGAAMVLIGFAIAAILTVVIPIGFLQSVPGLARAFGAASNSTMQTILRIAVLVLVSLMVLTSILGLDVALGAFAAGMLLDKGLRVVDDQHAEEVMHKIEIVGFSLLIPVFFVASGMNIDISAVLKSWPDLVFFVIMILCVRGIPVWAREKWTDTGSELTSAKEHMALGLFASTGLPIIVAVTEVAESSKIISSAQASVMVTGGALTVLIFPYFGSRIVRGRRKAILDADGNHVPENPSSTAESSAEMGSGAAVEGGEPQITDATEIFATSAHSIRAGAIDITEPGPRNTAHSESSGTVTL